MILGFAHLAVNEDNLIEAEAKWQAKGYVRQALYLDVPNHPSKEKFLTRYQARHDLMLLTGQGLWPLELTRHGATRSGNTQLAWRHEFIEVRVPDPAPLRRVLVEGLGFRNTAGDVLFLDGRLPGWSCRLHLYKDASLPVSLDGVGPTCLAFYCNHVSEDAQRLIDVGATDSTGKFDLTLGQRTMTITMMRAPGGLLLELISPRKEA